MQITKDWFKAEASTGANNCLEVRMWADGTTDLRDSKLGEDSPVLSFTAGEWAAFLDGAEKGEFSPLV